MKRCRKGCRNRHPFPVSGSLNTIKFQFTAIVLQTFVYGCSSLTASPHGEDHRSCSGHSIPAGKYARPCSHPVLVCDQTAAPRSIQSGSSPGYQRIRGCPQRRDYGIRLHFEFGSRHRHRRPSSALVRLSKLHSISNSIGQVLFQRTDIRDLFNQPTVHVSVPETGSVVQLTLW